MIIIVCPGRHKSLTLPMRYAFGSIKATGEVVVQQSCEEAGIGFHVLNLRDGLVGRTCIEGGKNRAELLVAGIPVDGVTVPEHIALVHARPDSLKLRKIVLTDKVVGVASVFQRFLAARHVAQCDQQQQAIKKSVFSHIECSINSFYLPPRQMARGQNVYS